MVWRRFAFLALALMLAGAAKSAAGKPALKANPKALNSITGSFEKLASARSLHLKVSGRFRQSQNKSSGTLHLFLSRNPAKAAAMLNARIRSSGMKMEFSGWARYLGNVLYFVLKQSPFGQTSFTGNWFEIDFGQIGKALNVTGIPEEKVSRAKAYVLPRLNFSSVRIREEKPEKAGGVLCRHYVAMTPLSLFVQLYLSILPKDLQASLESIKPFLDMASKVPPVPVEFWVGRKDGRLYRIFIPLGKQGALAMDVDYRVPTRAAFFALPAKATDARALGISLPLPAAEAMFPKAISPAAVKTGPIPNTEIDLQPLAPYKDEPVEKLRDFLSKQYGLDNVKILPDAPIPNNAYNSLRSQYAGETVLQEMSKELQGQGSEGPRKFLVLVTDQDLYSTADEKYIFVSMIDSGSSAILSFNRLRSVNADQSLARDEKLLARTLGFIYWKLPTTTLSQDLMYEGLSSIPDDLDRMGMDFLQDQSQSFLNDGIAEQDPEKAREDFLKALQYNPLYPKTYYLLAALDYKTGRYGEAADALNKALLIEPGNSDAFYLLGEADEKLGDFRRAAWEYEGSLMLSPDRTDAKTKLKALESVKQ